MARVQLDMREQKTFAKHLRKTHVYKQQAKHYLHLKSPVHVLHYCELDQDTCNNKHNECYINNILNGVHCYYIITM